MLLVDRRRRLEGAALYFVVEARPHGVGPEELLRRAIRGGVDVVQLRDKQLRGPELLRAALAFASVCREEGALFVVNDDPAVAAEAGADGVHVGQEDVSAAEARRIVGPDLIVGLSTHAPGQMETAGDADYIGVGTIFATPTKPGNDAAGLELVRDAVRVARLPWFAIGGIDLGNVREVVAAGARRVAVVRAIRDAEDPEAAARALRAALPA
jgi:thiamine-phosphate pyrophosphorylase